jgi:hypothetical protein
MKNLVLPLIGVAMSAAFACSAQTFSSQTSSGQSQSPQTEPAYVNNAQTTQLGSGGLTFSNRLGQIFSTDDLASKLQNLRTAVDETLPALQALNEQLSNSVTATSQQQSIGTALSGIVSDVLHKNQPSTQNSTAGQSAFSTSNLLSVLHGLLNKNSTGTAATPPANAQDLANLQRDLQPILADLQRLNVGPSVSPTSTPNPTGNTAEPQYPKGTLTPTGR